MLTAENASLHLDYPIYFFDWVKLYCVMEPGFSYKSEALWFTNTIGDSQTLSGSRNTKSIPADLVTLTIVDKFVLYMLPPKLPPKHTQSLMRLTNLLNIKHSSIFFIHFLHIFLTKITIFLSWFWIIQPLGLLNVFFRWGREEGGDRWVLVKHSSLQSHYVH